MRIQRSLIFFLGILLLQNVSFGQEFLTKDGKVIFISKASLSEFTGESDQLNGLVDIEKNLLDFYIDLNTLKTGIGLRDRHMRENYLETKKYPFAEFTGKMDTVPQLDEGKKVEVLAKGKFKIHGVERELEVKGFLIKKGNSQLELNANFKVKLSDYNIDIPKVMFYELAEEQEVSISAILIEK
ncbi:YceI family protein [Shivajiella indica]|uniref:YceI family protein n=1 Tax=Shivajiella indica TaxID=872115 RepID=A0ABW5B677_9BACT